MTQPITGWEHATLKELTLPIKKTDPVDAGRDHIRYIDIGSVDGGRHVLTGVQEIPAAGAPSRARQVVASGDTIFSTVRPYLEKIAYVDDSLDGEFASTGFSVLRPGPRLVPKFLYYFSISGSMLDQVLPYQKGVSYPAVLDKEVRATVAPVPPLNEQHRIVDILEDHLSRLDVGQRSLAAAETRLGLVIDAMIMDSPEVRSAPTKPLAELLASPLGNGKSVPTADTGFPVLRLTALRDGVIDLSQRKTGQWAADAAAPFLVTKGDVFATRGNGSLTLVGRAARVIDDPDPVAYPDTMIRMRPDQRLVRADFLTAVWNSRSVRRQIESRARTTAGIYKVNQKDLRGVVIPVPSTDDQASFMTRIDEWTYAVGGTRRSVATAARRAEALRRSLLAAAFSGRLTGRESDIERAEELAGV